MATPNIVPRADSEGQLGTSSKYWAAAYIDLIYLGAGKIGRDADNFFDFSTDNRITFRTGASNVMVLNSSSLRPNTDNGLPLGTSTVGWSDLFLADGAVINFDDGNVTLTHSSNALTLADNDLLAFGTGKDLRIYHDGSNSFIDYNSGNAGNLNIRNTNDDSDIILSSDDGSGGVTAYLTLDGGEKRTIFSENMSINDGKAFYVGDGLDGAFYHVSNTTWLDNYNGDLTITNLADDGDIIFKSDDGSGGVTTYFQLDGGEGRTVFKQNAIWQDNKAIYIGNGADLQIVHNGTDSQITNTTGNLQFTNTVDDKDISFASDNGAGGDAIYFYLDGSSATHDGSATTALYTNWPDNSRISLGTGHDLQFKHTGSLSTILNQVGDLYILNTANNKDIIFQSDDGSGGTTAYLTLDGGIAKTIANRAVRFNDGIQLELGSDSDLVLRHSGNDAFISNNGGDLYIENETNDGDILLRADNGSGGNATYLTLDGGLGYTTAQKNIRFGDGVRLVLGDNLDMQFHHTSGSNFLEINTGSLTIRNNADDSDIAFQSDDGSGGVATYFYLDGSSATHDGSATTALYTNWPDKSRISVGTGHDMRIFHDGTQSIIDNTNGDLFIRNFADDKDIIFSSDDGSGGVTPYLTLDGTNVQNVFGKRTVHQDSVEARFGNGSDMKIYHNSTDNIIETFSGDLYIKQQTDDGDIIFQSDDGSGGVETYFTIDGSVRKTEFARHTSHKDNIAAYFGDGLDLQIYHDGSNSYIDEVGTGSLYNRTTLFIVQNTDSTKNSIIGNPAAGVKLYYSGVLKFETTSTGIAVTGGVTSTSATGNASGAGFNTSGTVAINVGEINGEIITTIKVDLGTGAIVSSGTAGDVIGEDDTEGAFLTRITTAVNGIVYRGEMICVEVPTTGDPDINLAANSSATLAEDGAGEGEHVLINGGTATLAKHYPSFTIPSGGIQNDHLYLTHGGTTAGTYGAGQFIIKLYGAAVVS